MVVATNIRLPPSVAKFGPHLEPHPVLVECVEGAWRLHPDTAAWMRVAAGTALRLLRAVACDDEVRVVQSLRAEPVELVRGGQCGRRERPACRRRGGRHIDR